MKYKRKNKQVFWRNFKHLRVYCLWGVGLVKEYRVEVLKF